jgi:cell wall-associated NlpC family hydrolase
VTRRSGAASLLLLLVAAGGLALAPPARAADEGSATAFWTGIRQSIERNLGRPYVWGTSGLKSFDCSGFVWRVLADNGLLVKRTTARKYYMSLPRASGEKWRFGNIVFFDNLKHCGIVDGPDAFYHAQSSIGTNRSPLNAFWRAKVCGVRAVNLPPSVVAAGGE